MLISTFPNFPHIQATACKMAALAPSPDFCNCKGKALETLPQGCTDPIYAPHPPSSWLRTVTVLLCSVWPLEESEAPICPPILLSLLTYFECFLYTAVKYASFTKQCPFIQF